MPGTALPRRALQASGSFRDPLVLAVLVPELFAHRGIRLAHGGLAQLAGHHVVVAAIRDVSGHWQRGDLLAVFAAGAYAMSMASQYNSRPRAAEVLVHAATDQLIRRRETYEDLIAPELEP